MKMANALNHWQWNQDSGDRFPTIVNAQITGARVELKTDAIVRTSTAKEVTGGERLYGLVDGNLGWVYDMAAVGVPMKSHASFHLTKVSND